MFWLLGRLHFHSDVDNMLCYHSSLGQYFHLSSSWEKQYQPGADSIIWIWEAIKVNIQHFSTILCKGNLPGKASFKRKRKGSQYSFNSNLSNISLFCLITLYYSQQTSWLIITFVPLIKRSMCWWDLRKCK